MTSGRGIEKAVEAVCPCGCLNNPDNHISPTPTYVSVTTHIDTLQRDGLRSLRAAEAREIAELGHLEFPICTGCDVKLRHTKAATIVDERHMVCTDCAPTTPVKNTPSKENIIMADQYENMSVKDLRILAVERGIEKMSKANGAIIRRALRKADAGTVPDAGFSDVPSDQMVIADVVENKPSAAVAVAVSLTGADPGLAELMTHDVNDLISEGAPLLGQFYTVANGGADRLISILVALRLRHRNTEGLPDLGGSTQAYRNDAATMYRLAKVDKDATSAAQRTIRNHVSDYIRKNVDRNQVIACGLDPRTRAEIAKDKRAEKKAIEGSVMDAEEVTEEVVTVDAKRRPKHALRVALTVLTEAVQGDVDDEDMEMLLSMAAELETQLTLFRARFTPVTAS